MTTLSFTNNSCSPGLEKEVRAHQADCELMYLQFSALGYPSCVEDIGTRINMDTDKPYIQADCDKILALTLFQASRCRSDRNTGAQKVYFQDSIKDL